MLFTNLLLAVSLSAVDAFKNTSPFMFFSTSEILTSSPDIATAASITKTFNHELGKCPSDIYIIVSQPGVSAADFTGPNTPPHLQRWMTGAEKRSRSSMVVREVIGEIDVAALMETVVRTCGATSLSVDARTALIEIAMFTVAHETKPRFIYLDFKAWPPSGPARAEASRQQDTRLSDLLSMIPSRNFTVLYTTTPPTISPSGPVNSEFYMYEMDSTNTPLLHMDMRRESSTAANQAIDKNDKNTTRSNAPLFEKYQFFTPGIFMVLLVSSILLSILYVGISAISSVGVSYAAFERENGPAGQGKGVGKIS